MMVLTKFLIHATLVLGLNSLLLTPSVAEDDRGTDGLRGQVEPHHITLSANQQRSAIADISSLSTFEEQAKMAMNNNNGVVKFTESQGDIIEKKEVDKFPCDRSGQWYLPLNMPGQGKTMASPEGCRQRCVNTPGCNFFNNFPKGGCHITAGEDGWIYHSTNPTRVSGSKYCRADCDRSGRWYLPLNMPGQGKTMASPEGCRQRCLNTPGCNFFNNFPKGGCHITTGEDGFIYNSRNPTRESGSKYCRTD